MARLFLASLWLSVAHGAIDAHKIDSLPGYDGSELPVMWSGYIDVPTINGSAGVHYMLVQNGAADPHAPTVVWHQGGPGGSSMIGFMTENGPLTVNDFSYQTEAYNKSGVPTVYLNPHSWHLAPANMLYVEHPPPTGFSYCVGECHWNDTSHAAVNYEFLVAFFAAYPELSANEFFMSGESYAGVLVPTTALQLHARTTDANRATAPWSLGGWMVGNACPGNRVLTCTPYSGWIGTQVALDFRFGHGMISEQLYAKINAACEGQWGTFDAPSKECAELLEDPVRPCLNEAGDTYGMGGGYFLYDTCDPDLMALDPATNRPYAIDGGKGKAPPSQGQQQPQRRRQLLAVDGSGGSGSSSSSSSSSSDAGFMPNSGAYACGQEKGAQDWLNLEAVRSAIHVKTKAQSGRDFHFSTSLNYSFTAHTLLPQYKETLLPNYRVTQFSGDADPCVPYVGTQRWIESLGYDKVDTWHPWRVNGGVAGYVQTYAINNFSFVTVRDAGHMAPRYKPQQTMYMFQQFLKNQPL